MTVNHGGSVASLPLHRRARKPCNGRADPIGAHDEICCDLDGLSPAVANDRATDTAIRLADQRGQCAAVPDFRAGSPRGIHERAIQQRTARRIERIDPVLGSDLNLHEVIAVMEFRVAHRGRPGRNNAWQQAPPV